MYRYCAYVCLKLKEILAWVPISEGQFLFLRWMLEISFCEAEYLKICDYFAGAKCLLVQMSAIVEVAQNSLCWIFFICEGARNDLKFALIWSKPWISWALWMNKFLL